MKMTVFALAAVALLAASCGGGNGTQAAKSPGSSTASPSTSSSASGSAGSTTPPSTIQSERPSSVTGPRRCHTSDLDASLRMDGAAAGNLYATLVLTNASQSTCTINGYGGLQLLDAQRQAVPTHQHRDPTHPPTLITLSPGKDASAVLHWNDVPTGDEPVDKACEPQASFLKVTPPDETDSVVVEWKSTPVCNRGAIDQRAYAAGIVSP